MVEDLAARPFNPPLLRLADAVIASPTPTSSAVPGSGIVGRDSGRGAEKIVSS